MLITLFVIVVMTVMRLLLEVEDNTANNRAVLHTLVRPVKDL